MPGGTFIQLQSGGSSFGKIGITDTNGEYTYYSTLSSAVAASVAGDTIVFFTNITESGAVTVTVPDGVDINLNGFKYLLDNAGTDNAIALGGSSTVHIFNGTIARQGGSDNDLDSAAIYITTADKLQLTGVIVENASGVAIITSGGQTYGDYKVIAQRGFYAGNIASNSIKDAYIVSTGDAINGQAGGSGLNVIDCQIESSGAGILSETDLGVINCSVTTTGGSALSVQSADLQIRDSFLISLVGNAIFIANGSQLFVSNTEVLATASNTIFANTISNFIIKDCYILAFTNTPVRLISGGGTFIKNIVTASSNSNLTGVSLTLSSVASSTVAYNTINITSTNITSNSFGIAVTNTTPSKISFNKIYLAAKAGSYGIYSSTVGTNVYYLDNEFDTNSGALPVSPNITQLMANTPDAYGNILIG